MTIEGKGDDTPVECRLRTAANGLPNNRRPPMHHRSSTGLQLLFRSLKNNFLVSEPLAMGSSSMRTYKSRSNAITKLRFAAFR